MRLLSNQKVAVLLPFNAAGHMQSFLTIANRLREDHQVRCVFIVAGPPHSRTIEDHGHELIELEDLAEPYWDFEIEPGEDLSRPMDETEERARLAQGKEKRPFRGATRWPQFTSRHQFLFNGKPGNTHAAMAKFIDQIVPYMIGNSEQIDRTIDALQPDVIISDQTVAPVTMLKSEATRPWIRIWSPNPLKLLKSKLPAGIRPPPFKGFKLHTKEERAGMQRDQPELWNAILDEWKRDSIESEAIIQPSWSVLRKFYVENGLGEHLARCTDLERIRIDSPHLNLYMFPEAIDYDQEDDLFEYPARWLRCDSLIRNKAGPNETLQNEHWLRQIEAKMAESKLSSVVYFSLGSIASGEPGLMQRYIDYLASDPADRLYVVSKGVNGDKVRLAERNMLGANYLPQTFLLQQSKLAIIHGGNNSLTEALYYGKPMIILPAFADQFDNAQRVDDLRLGRRLDLFNCTRDELLQAVDELTGNEKLAERVRSIGATMRARDDLGKASDILWDLIEKRHSSQDQTTEHA